MIEPRWFAAWRRKDAEDAELIGADLMMDDWLSGKAPKEGPALVKHVIERLPDEGVKSIGRGAVNVLTKLADELTRYRTLHGAQARYEPDAGFHRGEVKIMDKTSAASPDPVNVFGASLPDLASGVAERLLIRSAYLVWTKDMIEALIRAGSRGVKIDILTNSPESTDSTWPTADAEEMSDRFRLVLADPGHAVVEYTIARDESGEPILRDGEPIVTLGAKDHTAPEVWNAYRRHRRLIGLVRKLPFVGDLRHPAMMRRQLFRGRRMP